MKPTNNLDPLLAGALEMERRPLIPARRWAAEVAEELTSCAERVAIHAGIEPDRQSAAQLLNTAEALGACVINLLAYSRGLVPRASSRKPDVNVIVPS